MPQPPSQSSQAAVIAEATVLSNPVVCREHHTLTLCVDGFPHAEPGQFVAVTSGNPLSPSQPIDCQDHSAAQAAHTDPCGLDFMLRRAFSIAGLRRHGESAEIDIIYRVVGKATRWMSQLNSHDRVNLLGPLGNSFTIESHHKTALPVAGGVGLPPMIWWAERLRQLNKNAVAFVGAQSRDLFALQLERDCVVPTCGTQAVFAAREFTQQGVKVVLSTDDGSLGFAGYVTGALENYLDAHPQEQAHVAVYTCGPELMMKAVADLCAQREIDCQLCMERSMACGIGTCQSCPVPVRDPAAVDGWRYKLCCTDGPVFDRREVIWE